MVCLQTIQEENGKIWLFEWIQLCVYGRIKFGRRQVISDGI